MAKRILRHGEAPLELLVLRERQVEPPAQLFGFEPRSCSALSLAAVGRCPRAYTRHRIADSHPVTPFIPTDLTEP